MLRNTYSGVVHSLKYRLDTTVVLLYAIRLMSNTMNNEVVLGASDNWRLIIKKRNDVHGFVRHTVHISYPNRYGKFVHHTHAHSIRVFEQDGRYSKNGLTIECDVLVPLYEVDDFRVLVDALTKQWDE